MLENKNDVQITSDYGWSIIKEHWGSLWFKGYIFEPLQLKVIVKDLKSNFKKIQSSIQDGSIRVSGKKRDELQEVISFLKSNDYNIYLNYGNFRD